MNNYIKPTTKVILVKTTSLLDSFSGNNFGGASGGTEGAGITDAGAKGGFLWDEDEDDDPMGAPSYNVWEE
jgi:hypothetical protein